LKSVSDRTIDMQKYTGATGSSAGSIIHKLHTDLTDARKAVNHKFGEPLRSSNKTNREKAARFDPPDGLLS
jgi:hypothetical protein